MFREWHESYTKMDEEIDLFFNHSNFLGRNKTVNLLVKFGANLNYKDKFGRTALIQAAQFGQLKCWYFEMKQQQFDFG